MSYFDPSRRPPPPRYPALAQYEDGQASQQDTQMDARNAYDARNSYGRAPWDDQQQSSAPWETAQSYQTPQWNDDFNRGAGVSRGMPEQLPWQGTGSTTNILSDSGRSASWDEGDGSPGNLGRVAAAFAGFLAAAVAIGAGNLAAAFVRPQASPIIAVGEDFINHTPSWLKNFAVEKFGENDKTMLLGGMYVTIALLAMVIGILAWRRLPFGVVGIGLFGLFGAFVAITLPASHPTDVIPSVIAGIVGIAAIVMLVRLGTTTTAGQRGTAMAGGLW